DDHIIDYVEVPTSEKFTPSSSTSTPLHQISFLDPLENKRANFYKNNRNNSSRSSYISSETLHTEFSLKSDTTSISSTKNSSLCKVLSASSLFTYIMRSILSMHNEALISCLINREMLDYYNSLTSRVSEEVETILSQIHRIKSQGCESHAQNIYDKLISHSDRLVDALNLFVNFTHKHLPVVYEELGKKVLSSLTSIKRRSTSLKIFVPSASENVSGYNNHSIRDKDRGITVSRRTSSEAISQRTRNQRNKSIGSSSIVSKKSSASISVTSNHQNPRKLHLPSFPRKHNKKEPYQADYNYNEHGGDSPSQSVPSSPGYSIKSNSRFKEQLKGTSSKIFPGILLSRRRFSDVSGTPPLRKSIYNIPNTKSSASLVESDAISNKDDIDVISSSRSRRSSSSSIKSYILKHVNPLSLSSKGKSSNVSETNNYWPVTEDATLNSYEYFPHSSKISSRSPSFSDKKHKLHKNNSFTDLRNLKKVWTDADKTNNESGNSTSHYLTPHIEDDGENSINDKERLFSATNSEGNENSQKLREQLFRRIVTKKSSNSLHAKKKPSLSNLIKIPQVFTRLNEEVIGKSEVFQNMEDGKLKGIDDLYNDDLVIETVDGSPQILAGKLDKLLSRLVDEQDAEFVDCFLHNHTFFMSSESLLNFMIQRYRNVDEGYHHHKTIISILDRWVTIQPQDVRFDTNLRDSMRAFLTDEVKEEEFKLEASKIKTILELQSLISMDRMMNQNKNPIIESAEESNDNIKITDSDNVPRPILSDSSPLLEFESKNIAKYLTLMDFAILKSITFFDVTIWWRKRKALETGVNLDAVLEGEGQHSSHIDSHLDVFTRRSNMISHWIAHEICSLKTVKARRSILHKFIETARYCREYNNFHIASCIALALNSRPVQRLIKTWESLSHQDIITFQSIEELIDPSRNMAKYRKSLANAKTPVIPFFAIFLKDLTFIIEGSSTYLSPNHLRNKLLLRIPSASSTYPESGETSPITPTSPSFSQNSFSSQQQISPLLFSSTQMKISSTVPNSIPISPLPSPLPMISQGPLINFEKFRFLSKNILNLKRYTSESYPFTNQLSGPPKILSSLTKSLPSIFVQNDLINTHNSLLINNLNSSGSGSRLAPLDHIGEVIERRMFAAAGNIFGGNVASIAMLDGGELEADLMVLSLEAETT
ncbi:1137_t:CDS:10, partial [Funneliformis mosseae]